MSKRNALFLALSTLLASWALVGLVLGLGWTPKLGLDLQGGFSVRLTAPEGTGKDVLEKAVEIMRRRIEALGNVQEPEIAVAGERSIEVQLPGVQERDRALAAVGSTGDLSFRPVINISAGISPVFADLQVDPPGLENLTTTTTGAGDTTSSTTTTVPPAGFSTPSQICRLGENGNIGLAPSQSYPLGELPPGVDATGLTSEDDTGAEAWLLEPSTGLIYHVGPALLTGSDVTGATATFTNQWVVDPSFSSVGSDRFEQATACLAGFPFGSISRQFAIVLDGEVVSAPEVRNDTDPTTGLDAGAAVITVGGGDDQQSEAEDLSTVLEYGALPTTFEADNTVAVSATLGSDSLRAGLIAGVGGLILVGLAMLLYYRALGLVTVLGLSVFGSLLISALGILSETQGLTLTLAGVTGIVVSIGITSDSYIVYFERIKEEVRKGRPLRAAVDSAFPRAFRTIVTADTVSIAGAVLLWLIAVGPVRGFAISLGIATVVDVIVAYFFTRPAAAYLVRTRWAEQAVVGIRPAVGRPAGEIAEATT